MEDACVATIDDGSAFEDNNQSMNGGTVGLDEDIYTKSLLLDIVNGCDLSHLSAVGKAAANDQLKLEENLHSEDFLNNNKETSEQSFFTNQRHVTSGDGTSIKDHLSIADNHKELFFIQPEDMENKETLNPVHDSSQCSVKRKGQAGRELYNEQTKQASENHSIKRNTDDIEENGEISPDEHEHGEIIMETKPCTHTIDQEEQDTASVGESEKPSKNDCLKFKSFKAQSISASRIPVEPNEELTLSDKALMKNENSTIMSQDCNNSHVYNDTTYTANCHSGGKKYGKHLHNNQCNIKTGTSEIEFGVGHLDLLKHSTESMVKNRSVIFQTKHSDLDLPKNEGTRTSKMKRELQSLKGGRSGSHYEIETDSHELGYFKKESLSEKEESSEEDFIDGPLHFDHSRDRLDHRNERHQYVSDQLDPDVLHLLEMHLRKQQLVDIKEEGEEELLDVHINKERPRSEPFKLLRNIPPVLDMVLEEPELENAGDLLEEDSQTSSEIDSDDSSNVCAMEMCLMKSLQDDLMSKSSKIDKHEIATILQTSSSETSPENQSKQKMGPLHQKNCEMNCEIIKKESDMQLAQSGDLQTTLSSVVDGDFRSDYDSDCPTVENSHNIGMEGDLSDPEKGVNDQHIPLNDKEDLGTDKDILQELDQSHEILINESNDKSLDSDLYQSVSDTAHAGTTLTSSNEEEFIGPQTSLLGQAFEGNLKSHDITKPFLENETAALIHESQEPNDLSPDNNSNLITGNSTDQPDSDKALGSEELSLTDLSKDLQANVKSLRETVFSEPSAEMSSLHSDLEEKILSILEKAHAADCRSSHLQAEAELLWKESIELRNECKSLSKEAAELLSVFTQQAAVHRNPIRQSAHKTKVGRSLLADTKPRNKETLSLNSKANSNTKKKREDQLQVLSKKLNFLREEAPEIMQELNVLQQDLKILRPHHSKPINVFYHLLWGGLVTGGTMLFVWWMNKQLG